MPDTSHCDEVLTFIAMKYTNRTINLILLLSIVFLGHGAVWAQNQGPEFKEYELVTLTDSRISTLSDRYNRTHQVYGYRVQIISSSKKEKAKKAKSVFASKYQGYVAHEIYQQPFFIIKVGDFLSKIEAEKLHREIREEFPESFVLPDIVTPFEQYSAKD
ncbi:MAG TPA: hypothetical protein DCX54_02410 [Flavobacteriales bacterium]|nr:hypothetical protein [Flavobacteriales bacterium]